MRMSKVKRTGSGGAILLVLLVLCAAWVFVLRPGGAPVSIQPTRPVVTGTEHDYHAFNDSFLLVDVRNTGGAGFVKVAVSCYHDKERTRLIDSWSTRVFLQAGEERRVSVRLRELKEGRGVYSHTTATAE